MKRAAVIAGLILLAASAAQAQGPTLSGRVNGAIGGPLGGGDAASDRTPRRGPPRDPAPPAAGCVLMSKAGAPTPLPGFDPAKTSTPLPQPQADPMMVMCDRTTVVPQVTDYRVLLEMQLPLVIRVGDRLLVVGAKDGQFQFSMERGAATPAETAALDARRDEMQKAAGAKLQ
jgi:hypothetical protein